MQPVGRSLITACRPVATTEKRTWCCSTHTAHFCAVLYCCINECRPISAALRTRVRHAKKVRSIGCKTVERCRQVGGKCAGLTLSFRLSSATSSLISFFTSSAPSTLRLRASLSASVSRASSHRYLQSTPHSQSCRQPFNVQCAMCYKSCVTKKALARLQP